MATGGTGAGPEPLGASAARTHEPWARVRAIGLGARRGAREGAATPGLNTTPAQPRPLRARLAAHPSPRARTLAHGSCVLAAEAPKGSGLAHVPPVAMYVHKKGIEITYIITKI